MFLNCNVYITFKLVRWYVRKICPRLTFEALLGKSIILAFVLFELFLELNQTVANIEQLNDAAATK